MFFSLHSQQQLYLVTYVPFISESTLQKNHIASFLTLLRNMVIPSNISQDTLLRENALATLGLLLQNVRGELIDGNYAWFKCVCMK